MSAGGAGGSGPVLVTGAARRIGLAIAARLAHCGRPVVLHASHRSIEEAELAAQAIRAKGGRAAVVGADLSDARETEALMGIAARAFGPVTLLVNNASVFELDAAQDFSVDVFDRQFAIDLRAPLLLARDMAAQLPEEAEGAIVNIVDQRVFRLTPRYFTYTLAKSALWTATRTMAQAFAPRIRVNAVGPGPVFPNTVHGQTGFETEARGVPLRRPADVSGVVDAVVFLAEARSVTGQMIAVDGGQHLAWETPDVLPD
ncbi:SDR family oxidoreductase [Methylosinus sporium]|uniref:SDR family oxidoreductase n=1 Tax=Methylosinus sporium TaxID=428 RepID=A0A549T3X7_METSR|nr:MULTISPECIES: SDR family oxidoreductase [Methylosinus]MBU3886882.1 SDR family oxidoreductase [Methylosinus sp. KRF6]TRL36522.1 SDR family oxidoreductase [Methylosinus sporium]